MCTDGGGSVRPHNGLWSYAVRKNKLSQHDPSMCRFVGLPERHVHASFDGTRALLRHAAGRCSAPLYTPPPRWCADRTAHDDAHSDDALDPDPRSKRLSMGFPRDHSRRIYGARFCTPGVNRTHPQSLRTPWPTPRARQTAKPMEEAIAYGVPNCRTRSQTVCVARCPHGCACDGLTERSLP